MTKLKNALTAWNTLNSQITQCEACPRLRTYCQEIAAQKRAAFRDQNYWGKPVPNFGDPQAQVLIVGLAPAAHGANRTGRMFTGDRSGEWLYRALHKAGFANQAISETATDALRLHNCAITATCHCAPPDNKPTNDEIRACRGWLQQTFNLMSAKVFIALGQIAWKAIVEEAKIRNWWNEPMPKFGHLARQNLGGDRWLLGSYHPSQQNTFTGRLTEAMFDQVFQQATQLLSSNAR